MSRSTGAPSRADIRSSRTPPASTSSSATRHDALEVAERAGAAAVTAADVDSSPVPTVAGASLLGVALAIAARLEADGSDVLRVAIAHPGGPSLGGVGMAFPPPVGKARGTILSEAPLNVVSASTQEPWAAIVVESNSGDQAVVDEHRFLMAICLAAGVALLPPAGIVKVWDVPDVYLSKAETHGPGRCQAKRIAAPIERRQFDADGSR